MELHFSLRRIARIYAAAVLLLGIGTFGFHLILDESWLNSFYRTVVTATLNGLDAPGGRLWTIAVVLGGVTIFAYVGAAVVEAIAGGSSRARLQSEGGGRRSTDCAITSSSAATAASGRRVAQEFRAAGVPYVVLDYHEDAIDGRARERRSLHRGNGTEDEDLERRGLAHARGLVASSDDDADNLYISLSARAARPDIFIVARATDEDAEKKLKLAGADRVVAPYSTAGRVMANLVLKPQVAAFLDVVTTAEGDDFLLEEIEVHASCPQAGRTIRDLDVRDKTGAMVVALRKSDGTFDTTPSPDERIEVGDILIGVGTTSEIRALEELFAPQEAVAR